MQPGIRHASTEETIFTNASKRNLREHWSWSQVYLLRFTCMHGPGEPRTS